MTNRLCVCSHGWLATCRVCLGFRLLLHWPRGRSAAQLNMLCQTKQRELVHWELVGLQVISGQSGVMEPAVTCAVRRLPMITAHRDAHAYPYTHSLCHLHRERQDQRESYCHRPFTTATLPLGEGSRERCYSAAKPQQLATSSHITLKRLS